MAKSTITFNKKEREKKKFKKQQDKKEKSEERKNSSAKGKSLEEMMAYVDENGNISSTPPNPSKKKQFVQEDIQIGVAKRIEVETDVIRNGIVTFFNESKGYGFIKDLQTQESVFVHINALTEPLSEQDKVTFETEPGQKGLQAVRVKKTS